jgi:hypothetical protein
LSLLQTFLGRVTFLPNALHLFIDKKAAVKVNPIEHPVEFAGGEDRSVLYLFTCVDQVCKGLILSVETFLHQFLLMLTVQREPCISDVFSGFVFVENFTLAVGNKLYFVCFFFGHFKIPLSEFIDLIFELHQVFF